MVYLLLLVLGLVVLLQSYLMFSLMQSQRDLQTKVSRLLRVKKKKETGVRKTSTERGRVR